MPIHFLVVVFLILILCVSSFVCLLLFMSFASKPVTEMLLSNRERSHIHTHVRVIEPEAKCKSKSRKQLRCVDEVEVEQDRSSISNNEREATS